MVAEKANGDDQSFKKRRSSRELILLALGLGQCMQQCSFGHFFGEMEAGLFIRVGRTDVRCCNSATASRRSGAPRWTSSAARGGGCFDDFCRKWRGRAEPEPAHIVRNDHAGRRRCSGTGLDRHRVGAIRGRQRRKHRFFHGRIGWRLPAGWWRRPARNNQWWRRRRTRLDCHHWRCSGKQ